MLMVVLAAMALLPIASVASETSEPQHYTVRFLSGGTLIRSYDAIAGDTIPDSAVPTVADIMAAGYSGEIIGWNLEGSNNKFFTTDTSKIDGDVFLSFQNHIVSGNTSFSVAYAESYLHESWLADPDVSAAGADGADAAENVSTATSDNAGQTGQSSAVSGQVATTASAQEPVQAPAAEMSGQPEATEVPDLRSPSELLPSAGVAGGLSGLKQGSGLSDETIQALIRDGFSDDEILQMGKQTGNIIVDLESDSVPFGNGSVRNAWSLLSMLMAIAAAIMILHIKFFVQKRQWRSDDARYRVIWELQTITITLGGLTLILWFMVDNLMRPIVWTNRYTGYVALYFILHLVLYYVYRTYVQKMNRRRKAKARYRRPQERMSVPASERA